MYLGRVVEQSPTEKLFAEPLHPYTQALLKAAPTPKPRRKEITPAVLGDIPSPIDRPTGCHFHPRCKFAMPICRTEYPALRRVGSAVVACHLYADDDVRSTERRRPRRPLRAGNRRARASFRGRESPAS
jgi:peptide/nickel transport system ATP-binding protein